MRASFGLLTAATVVWIAIALALQYNLIAPNCSLCTTAALVELNVRVPGAAFHLPPIGLMVLLGIPLLALALYLVPWKALRAGALWQSALQRWLQPFIWLLVALFCILGGHWFYLPFKPALPSGVQNFVEAFELSIKLSSLGFNFLSIDGNLTAMVGMVVGFALFIQKGVKRALAG
jgi:hypothetical protein